MPIGEEAQCRSFAAQLVFSIVQIGQILDLRDGQCTTDRRPQGSAQHGLLVEQSVEDAASPKTGAQTASHAVHPALAGHVFTEDEYAAVRCHQVGQGGVDGHGECHRACGFGESVIECLAPELGRGQQGCRWLDRQGLQRRHHFGCGAQVLHGGFAGSLHVASDLFIALQDHLGCGHTQVDSDLAVASNGSAS